MSPMLGSYTKVSHLKKILAEEVMSGKYKVGEKLPSIRKIAEDFNVSHVTASQALSKLSSSGLIDVKPGVGAFVSAQPQKSNVNNITIGLAELSSSTAAFSQSSYNLITPYIINGFNTYFADGRATLRFLPYEKWKLTGVNTDFRSAIESAQIGGVIIKGPVKPEEIDFITEHRVPLVLCNHLMPERQVPRVFINWESGFQKLISRLFYLGHRKIELITYSEEWVVQQNGINGYIRVARELGLDMFSQENIHVIDNTLGQLSHGRYDDKVAEAMSKRPTAIVAFDEVIANRVVRHCYENDLKIPRDVSLVALNDMMPGSHPISLTTLDTQASLQDMMWESCSIIEKAIKGKIMLNERVMITASMIEGESVSRPKQSVK